MIIPLEKKAHANTDVRTEMIQPFLKWAGGKRQLLPFIHKYLPRKYNNYFEPFVGAGALLFDLKPTSAFINDINEELINCYDVIRDFSEELIADLIKHKNNSDYFYDLRKTDRGTSFSDLTNIQRASRIIYLNKTCFNGLFRVNSQGQFNAPFGSYKKPNIVNETVIRSVSRYLRKNNVTTSNVDFSVVVQQAGRGDFIYLDPPYDPISETASFTGYSLGQFNRNEQVRLRDCFNELTVRGCKVMLSNSSTKFVADLYADFNIIPVNANRNINSVGSSRQKVEELLILNYTP